MDSLQIREKLGQFFERSILYGESADELDGETSLVDEGYIDSTGIVELVSFIEREFDMRVRDIEVVPENFDTFNALCMFIMKKLHAGKEEKV